MRKETFELYAFKGQKILFTPARAGYLEEPVPEVLFKYEIRHSDEGFEPCELAKHILVNHYGTIFSRVPIDLGNDGYIEFQEGIDFIDLNQVITFEEYLDILEENYDLKEQEISMKITM